MGAPVRVGLLGPFELVVDGCAVPLPARVRGLAAILAGRAGHPVPVPAIIEGLWGDGPPPSDRNTLQTYVAQLRRALEPQRSPGAAPSLLVTVTADAYRLDLDGAAVDALAFEHLVSRARAAGTAPERLAAVEAALRLWRGEPLLGVSADGYVTAERARLGELWRQAQHLRAEALIAAGEPERAAAAVEAALGCLPYDEGLWALAVRAYGACGRRADALAAYRRARRTLVEELGLEPGAELRAAEAAVLADEPVRRPGVRAAAPAAADEAHCAVPPVRVVLAEDDLLVREGLLRLIERLGDVCVLAAVGTLDELLEAVDRHQPDVVVTDICMPPSHGDEGLQAAAALRRDHPGTAVLVLSQYADPAYAHRLLACGARGRGYLIKERLGHRGKLRDAIRAVHAGESRIDPDIVDLLVAYRGGAPAQEP